MSWLGEHFSSITEKLSDITKEILIDDSNVDKLDASNQNGVLSYNELLELCKEKDQKINSLIFEKENLESSIEELARQHQEVIDVILQQKNQIIAENYALKQNFAFEKQKLLEKAEINFKSLVKSSEASSDLKDDIFESQSCDSVGDNINLISILQSVSDCSEDEKFKKQIDQLEKQKDLLNADDKSSSNLVNKIDNYVNFLEALHSQSLYSVVDEICSIFNSLESDNNQLKEKLSSSLQEKKFERLSANISCSCQTYDSKSHPLQLKANSETQTNIEDFQNIFSSTSVQTLEENTSSSLIHTSEAYEQSFIDLITENDVSSSDDISLYDQLKLKIATLEKEKSILQENISNLQSLLNKNTSPITQVDEKLIENLRSDLLTAQTTLQKQNQAYHVLQNKYSEDINHLNEKLQAYTFSMSEQNSKIMFMKEKISSLEEYINDIKQGTTNLEKESCYNEQNMSTNINLSSQHNIENNQIFSFSEAERTLLLEKLKASDLEKGKLLCVLNEKTQECSSLKAEVHKLTNIVASEKQALLKLQQDNCDLRQSNEEKPDSELTKETIKKLSTLIKDKDLEIESLIQKNSTLITLIQNITSIPEQLQSLIEEKEKLSKQVHHFKAERERIMLTYNTKDKEWRECVAELKKINNLMTEKQKEYDGLEQYYLSVAQQYEEKQKSFINSQNEIITLKHHVGEMEQKLIEAKEKHSDLLNIVNSDNNIQISKDEFDEKNSKIEKLICNNIEKDNLIQEKDCIIHDLSQQVKKLKLEIEQHLQLSQELQEKITNLTKKLEEENVNSGQLQNYKLNLEQRLQDKSSELELLKEMNERLNMSVKEKEFTVQSMTEKISSLSQYICSDTSSGTADVNQILADSESMFSEAQKFRHERDETLLALNQSKQDNQSLRNEIQRMKSTEIHLENQLSRLRQHLLEVEENYTNEALKAEEREKCLKDELVEVKRRADINSTAVVDTNQRASIQIASLQEQLSMVANQRDEALLQVSSLEDKVLQHSTAVNKLQLVLEQMQKSNERKFKEIDNRWLLQLDNQKELIKQLEKQLQIKQMQLEESSKALEAASRLSEQLDAKEEVINNLKKELSKTENQIKSTAIEIDSIKSNTEGKVDRVVMKSLVLGYFSTPPEQKSEVIRLLARVLDFNQEEMAKAGIVVGRHTKRLESRGIFSTIFNRLPSLSSSEPTSLQVPEKSFTTLFVQFLESESQPLVPMSFPAEKMAQDLKSKTQLKKRPEMGRNTPSRPSPLLIDIDSAFPTFTPVPAVEYSISPAPAILKEVLE